MNWITSGDAIDSPLLLWWWAVELVMGSVIKAAVFALNVDPVAAERSGSVER